MITDRDEGCRERERERGRMREREGENKWVREREGERKRVRENENERRKKRQFLCQMNVSAVHKSIFCWRTWKMEKRSETENKAESRDRQ